METITLRLGFPGSSVGKESACNAGGLSSIPGWGRSPGEGNSPVNSHLFPCLGPLQGRVGFVLGTVVSPALIMMQCSKSPGMQHPNMHIIYTYALAPRFPGPGAVA